MVRAERVAEYRYAFQRIDRQTVSETNTADMLEALTPFCHVKGGDAQEGRQYSDRRTIS